MLVIDNLLPVPGLVDGSPANNHYEPGISSALMLKDMRLALEAAENFGARVEVAKLAASLYTSYFEAGNGTRDFSGIINLVRNSSIQPIRSK